MYYITCISLHNLVIDENISFKIIGDRNEVHSFNSHLIKVNNENEEGNDEETASTKVYSENPMKTIGPEESILYMKDVLYNGIVGKLSFGPFKTGPNVCTMYMYVQCMYMYEYYCIHVHVCTLLHFLLPLLLFSIEKEEEECICCH